MALVTNDNEDELRNMREEGLRCQEVARREADDLGLTKWQNCVSRIEAMIARRRVEDLGTEDLGMEGLA